MTDQPTASHQETNKTAPVDLVLLEQPFNVQISRFYSGKSSSGAVDLSKIAMLNEWLANDLNGMSQVKLVEMKLLYMMTGERQVVQAGFSHANATLTMDQASMLIGGVAHTSTAYNYGVKLEDTLVIPQTLSTQLQPYDPHRPAAKFYLFATKGVKVSIVYRLKFADYLFKNDTEEV
jgi:hypothetical protein